MNQFKIRSDVLVHLVVAGVGLSEIHDEVCPASGQGYKRLILTVENVIGRFVAKLGKGFEDFFAVMERIFLLLRALAVFAARRLDWFWLGLRRAFFPDIVQDRNFQVCHVASTSFSFIVSRQSRLDE